MLTLLRIYVYNLSRSSEVAIIENAIYNNYSCSSDDTYSNGLGLALYIRSLWLRYEHDNNNNSNNIETINTIIINQCHCYPVTLIMIHCQKNVMNIKSDHSRKGKKLHYIYQIVPWVS